MLVLRTLGSCEVHRTAGGRTSAVHVEPKRMALLVYLAVGQPGGAASRDALMELFWPDLSQAAARSALRQGLHHLSARLGPEALIGRGTAEVGVDPARVRCDALRFDAALDSHQSARAMRIYTGEFLAGFFYGRASRGFEEWVATERARFRERAFEATLLLAAEEERRANHTGEVHWLKRALEIEPFREDLLHRVVGLYEAVGNRATAAQTIRSFTRELRSMHGVTVSPETRRLLERLQGGIGTRTDPAPERTRELQEEVRFEMNRTLDLVRGLQVLARRTARGPADVRDG